MSAIDRLKSGGFNAQNPPPAFSAITLDEPLVADWILDQYKKLAREAQFERVRIDATSAKGWTEAAASLNSLSLFSSNTLVELHISHKPDKKQLAELKGFTQQSHGNLLVALFPPQDYRQIKHEVFVLARAGRGLIETALKSEGERKSLLQIKASQMGLSLSPEAWSVLMEQTQNNLLAAFGALQRLSAMLPLLRPQIDEAENQPLSADELNQALVSHSRFSHLDLIEATLKGQSKLTLEICEYLEQTGESPPQLIWQLSNVTRKLTQLVGGLSVKEAQIWPRNMAALHERAARKLRPVDLAACSALVLMADQTVKGAGSHNPWLVIRELCLRLSGHRPALTLVGSPSGF